MSDHHVRPATAADIDVLSDCWLEFASEMAELDPYNELAEGDLRAAQEEYRREALADEDQRILLAVEGAAADVTGSDDGLAGYVTAERKESPPVFARGARLNVGELFLREPYRGEGLDRPPE